MCIRDRELAGYIRARSAAALITPHALLLEEVENADELLAQMPADPQCTDIVTRAGAKDTYYSVSYTHLDVYKRQLAAIATCLLVSRVIGVAQIAQEVEQDGQRFRRKPVFNFMIRWLCPIFAAIILASSVANAFGWIAM